MRKKNNKKNIIRIEEVKKVSDFSNTLFYLKRTIYGLFGKMTTAQFNIEGFEILAQEAHEKNMSFERLIITIFEQVIKNKK